MPNVTYLSWQQYVNNMITTAATACPALTNFTSGSVAMAFFMAVAGVAINLQTMISGVQSALRLGTSQGTDVDTWIEDWGYSRAGAQAASGQLTCNYTGIGSLRVYPGALCQTPQSLIQFVVVADPGNTTGDWDAGSNSYLITGGTGTVLVQCSTPGILGNILANTLTQITSGFAGFSSITNALPYTNGQNSASDAAAKTGFLQYIQSLGSGNYAAIAQAILGVGHGVVQSFNIIEGFHFNGSTFTAGFCVVADDGTGSIGSGTLSNIATAIDAVRAVGSGRQVSAPTNVPINVSVHLSVASGLLSATEAAVSAAVATYINTLGVAAKNTAGVVPYAGIGAVIAAVPNVNAYSSLLVNSGTSNIVITGTQLPRMGTMTYT